MLFVSGRVHLRLKLLRPEHEWRPNGNLSSLAAVVFAGKEPLGRVGRAAKGCHDGGRVGLQLRDGDVQRPGDVGRQNDVVVRPRARRSLGGRDGVPDLQSSARQRQARTHRRSRGSLRTCAMPLSCAVWRRAAAVYVLSSCIAGAEGLSSVPSCVHVCITRLTLI